MVETFAREAAGNPQAFTGERLTSALSGQTQIEHYHRYLVARGFCAGRDVLDVASGEGYGSAQIAQVARSVVGLEYSAATVRSAAANFPRPNLTYVQGDARAMPLPAASFDVVVSFETIEHFDRQEDFLAEVRRVLRPGGRFIVSTPDRDIYSPAGAPPNPFHVKELDRAEFTALLGQHFAHLAFLLQRPLIGSVMMGDVPAADAPPPLVFDRPDPARFAAAARLPRAPYIVAVASDRPVEALPASVFIDRSDLDTDRIALTERSAELAQARTELDHARAEAAQARTEAEQARTEADQVRNAAELARQVADARLAAVARDLDAARGSARTFLRHYLPRLRRHLLGTRRR